jgi:hypothetical protein
LFVSLILSERYYDQNTITFREGDLALLLQQNVRRARTKKLPSPRTGTYVYIVVEVTDLNCITFRYEDTQLQGAEQQTSALHSIPNRRVTRDVVGSEPGVHRHRLHNHEL